MNEVKTILETILKENTKDFSSVLNFFSSFKKEADEYENRIRTAQTLLHEIENEVLGKLEKAKEELTQTEEQTKRLKSVYSSEVEKLEKRRIELETEIKTKEGYLVELDEKVNKLQKNYDYHFAQSSSMAEIAMKKKMALAGLNNK